MSTRIKARLAGLLAAVLFLSCGCGAADSKKEETVENAPASQQETVTTPDNNQDNKPDSSGSGETPNDSVQNTDNDTEEQNTDSGSSANDITSMKVVTTKAKTAVSMRDAAMTGCYTVRGDQAESLEDSVYALTEGDIVLILGEDTQSGMTRIAIPYGEVIRYGYVDADAISTDADTIRSTANQAMVHNAALYNVPEEDFAKNYTGMVTVGDVFDEGWCPITCMDDSSREILYVKESDLSFDFDTSMPDIEP